jgi:hypothetical protein
MSSIPNNAIPHAGPAEAEAETESPTLVQRASQQARRAADLVRDNPKTVIAAGAAVAAGVAAAAAIPLVRARLAGTASTAAKSGGGKRTPKKG